MIHIHIHRRRRDGCGAHRTCWRRSARRRAQPLMVAVRAVGVLLVLAGAVLLVVVASGAVAWAQVAPTEPGVDSIVEVVNRMRIWLVGILAAVATFFATVGAFRLMWADGDPGEVDKGKRAIRSAAIGYAAAILAPLLVTIVTGFVA